MTKEEFTEELVTIIHLVEQMEMTEDQLDEYIEELAEHDADLADAVEDAFVSLARAAKLAAELKGYED